MAAGGEHRPSVRRRAHGVRRGAASLVALALTGCSAGGLEPGFASGMAVTRGEHSTVSTGLGEPGGWGTVVETRAGAAVTRLHTVRNPGPTTVTLERIASFPAVRGDGEDGVEPVCATVVTSVDVLLDGSGAADRGEVPTRDAALPFGGGLRVRSGVTAFLWVDETFVDDGRGCPDAPIHEPAPTELEATELGRTVTLVLEDQHEPLQYVPDLDAHLARALRIERAPDPVPDGVDDGSDAPAGQPEAADAAG